jgi:hypothetical protein
MTILHSDESELRAPVTTTLNTETGKVVVHLDKVEYGFFNQPILYQDRLFQPKSELHITVISKDSANLLLNYMTSHPEDKDEIQELILVTDWSYHKLNKFYYVEEEPGVETIIQMVDVPALTNFFKDLSKQVGQGFILPPTHVTLYTRGTEKGISLPNRELFEERVKTVLLPVELHPVEDQPGTFGLDQESGS